MKKLFVITMLQLIVAAVASAQGISPILMVFHPKHGHVASSFNVLNNSLTPMVTTLEVRAFAVDEEGHVSLEPMSPENTVTLSTSSLRVPPLSKSSVNFSADCPSACQFFIIANNVSVQKASTGMNVRILLPETIYVWRLPIHKQDVTATWIDAETLLVQNNGAGGDRPLVDAVIDAKSQPLPSFPLNPGAKRVIHFPSAPSEVVIRGAEFTLKVTH